MLLKKALSYFLLPYPMAVTLLLVGILLLWFTGRQRVGKILVTLGAGTLFLFSIGTLAGLYVRPLQRFTPLGSLVEIPEARWVVVLGSGCSPDANVPANARLNSAALQRLCEGIRLYRTRPGVKLVLSGGASCGAGKEADVMAQAAEALGVPRSEMILEAGSRDTEDEASLVRGFVGGDQFALVTSVFHMRRSMKIFKKQGMNPVPAPAGYWSSATSALPSSAQLAAADAADHEYVGMLWALLRGTL